MEWLHGILVNIRASLTSEEDSDNYSDTSSQSSTEGSIDSNASGGSFEDSEEASTETNSDSDADSEASSEADESDGNKSGSESGGSVESRVGAAFGTNTDSDSSLSITSDKRMFDVSSHRRTPGRDCSNWCSVSNNYDYPHIVRNYHDYTGEDMWDEVSAFLNAKEPVFKAQAHSFFILVETPKDSHVQRLKQLLVELEPRYKGYSVPKLTRLVAMKLNESQYSMQAAIEYQGKYGHDAALYLLETHADVMFARAGLRCYYYPGMAI